MATRQRVSWGVISGIVLALLGWAFTGMNTYATENATVKQRLSVVETKQDTSEKRLERMESKIDRLLERGR